MLTVFPDERLPDCAEQNIDNLKPLPFAVFREFCKQRIQDEEHGAELLEIWTNQAFELLQSGHGVKLWFSR